MDDFDYAYQRLDELRNSGFRAFDESNYVYSNETIVVGYNGASNILVLPNKATAIEMGFIKSGVIGIEFDSNIQYIQSSGSLPASMIYAKYDGTMAEFAVVMANVNTTSGWNAGSGITKVICSDGEASL
jgi:hypothetical protein